MPEFDREGGSQRVFHLIELLLDAGWSVSFAAQNATGGERYARVLQQMGVATYASRDPWSGGSDCLVDFESLVSTGHYDLALVAFWDLSEQYLPLVRAHSPATKFVVDSIDLHFLRNARNAFHKRWGVYSPTGPLDQRYAGELIRELNVYGAADAVLTVSQKEADLINDFTGDPARAYSVPETEVFPASPFPFDERKGILFVGNFRHPPNAQAVEYLCRDVLPRVAPEVLDGQPVYIVGNGLTEKVAAYAGGLKNVLMVGWVPEVLPYLHRARVSVIPLLYGAGTKRKLMQAMTVGTPSVSTGIGVEGLGLEDGVHVLVADDPQTFADSLTRLLVDEGLWRELARRGREHMLATHGPEAVRERFRSVLSRIMGRPVVRAKAASPHAQG
jgi:glycosyltransferase involved in cell wall biosynthesis